MLDVDAVFCHNCIYYKDGCSRIRKAYGGHHCTEYVEKPNEEDNKYDTRLTYMQWSIE